MILDFSSVSFLLSFFSPPFLPLPLFLFLFTSFQ
jgi:hypothetical protein